MRRGFGAIPFVIALAVLSLVASACSTAGGVTTSRADFRRAANAICAAADATAAKVEEPAQVDGPGIASTVASIVVIERGALRQLRKLILPPADGPAIRSWFRSVRKTIDATAAVGTESAKGDFNAATAARDRGTALAATADASARSLGLDQCATPANPTTPGSASTSTAG